MVVGVSVEGELVSVNIAVGRRVVEFGVSVVTAGGGGVFVEGGMGELGEGIACI